MKAVAAKRGCQHVKESLAHFESGRDLFEFLKEDMKFLEAKYQMLPL